MSDIPRSSPRVGETERVFVNGRLLTMTSSTSPTEMLVVAGDRIVAVGGEELLVRFPHATVHDLGGRTLCPGFVDAHHHLSIAALHPRWADARGVTTMAELADLLRVHARADPQVPWIRAAGWTDIGSGFVPHRRDLDSLGLDRPIIVAHYSLHQCVADGRALDDLGIGETTPDPVGGAIGRDEDGKLNGLLVERAWASAHARSLAPYQDPDRWAEHIRVAAQSLLADGITAIHDTACSPEAEAAYRVLARQAMLPVSVLVCPHPAALLSAPELDRWDGPPTGEGDEILRMGPVKLFADGGVAPGIDVHYRGDRLVFGTLFPNLGEHVTTATSLGHRVAVHAIGNAGLEAALSAFSEAASLHPEVDHRFRVEHACLATRGQLDRLSQLGGVAVVQPGFLHHLGQQVEGVLFDDATWLPFADVQGAGVTMAASSDCPCTFSEPLRTSALGTTRRTGSGKVMELEQSVSYEDWLRAYTAGAAYAGGQEAERGQLAPGMRADLVVLDGELDVDHPPRVAETWVGGRLVYASPPPSGV